MIPKVDKKQPLVWKRFDGMVCPRVPIGTDNNWIMTDYLMIICEKLYAYEQIDPDPQCLSKLCEKLYQYEQIDPSPQRLSRRLDDEESDGWSHK